MPRIVGIDHLVLSVGDFARSKEFYDKLLKFLGFKLKHEYDDMAGWSNGKTLFWVAAADAEGRKHKYRKGDIGFHHYAFEMASRERRRCARRLPRYQRRERRRSAGRILRPQLLRGLFHRSGRHEARRHDLGAAGKEAQARLAKAVTKVLAKESGAQILSGRHAPSRYRAQQAADVSDHVIAAAAFGGIERVVRGLDQIGARFDDLSGTTDSTPMLTVTWPQGDSA